MPSTDRDDIDAAWMTEALKEAARGGEAQEVPVGAVAVLAGEIVARGHNQTITTCDPTAHAEIVVLRHAARALGIHRLTEVELYVSLEPCAMCVGAMIQARIRRLVFGCRDPKAGAVVSLYGLALDERLNHRIPFREGIQDSECRRLLQEFFRARR